MKTRRGNSGFSAIEILMSIAVFGLVAAGLLTTSVGATRGNLKSKGLGAASALIYDKVEQLRAIDPTTNPADITAGLHADPLNPLTATGQPNGHFARTWEVTEHVPRHGLSEVVITVTWPGTTQTTIQGVTYVCNTRTCG